MYEQPKANRPRLSNLRRRKQPVSAILWCGRGDMALGHTHQDRAVHRRLGRHTKGPLLPEQIRQRQGHRPLVGRQEVIWEAAGSDCGGRGQLELLTQPQTEAELLRDGLLLILTGDIDGMTCVLECSSDLKKWHVLDTVSLEASPQVYVDKSAEQCPHWCLQPMRFYRVKLVE